MTESRYFSKARIASIISLSFTGFFLPLSEWMLSVSIILLFLSSIITSVFSSGISRKRLSLALLFSIIYIVHLVWMINTDNLSYGLSELRLKLPLLVIPFSLALTPALSEKEVKYVFTSFIAGVLLSSILGIANLIINSPGNDPRELLSPFISHIRLSLMVLVAIIILLFGFIYPGQGRTNQVYVPIFLWLIVFMFILFSLTGVLLLFISLSVSLFYLPPGVTGRRIKRSISLFLIAFLILASTLIIRDAMLFLPSDRKPEIPMEEISISGSTYVHYPERKDMENGFKVWINICEPEMRKEWNRLSAISYDSADQRGQEIRYTLIRYLSSLGLNKDSASISSLSVNDIHSIENGHASTITASSCILRAKIYELVWQVHYFLIGGNPSGHSVTQRLYFLQNGWRVFSNNIITGAGTGDLPDEIRKQYDSDKTPLSISFRLLPHNQILTFLCMFGLAGFLLIAFAFSYTAYKTKVFEQPIPAITLLIIILSMLWEDTLATHTGISFFAYFYSLFIFRKLEEKE